MTTKRKSETARINGARSRGPVTAEGKQIASQNAIRHGMLAQTVVLEGESDELFQQLITSFTKEIQPRSPIETALVETMAIARWRQMRVWAIQKAGFDFEMSRPENFSGAKPTRFALTFKSLSDNSRVLDLIHRYETAYDRQFSRALSLLLKLRSGQSSPTAPVQPSQRDAVFPHEPTGEQTTDPLQLTNAHPGESQPLNPAQEPVPPPPAAEPSERPAAPSPRACAVPRPPASVACNPAPAQSRLEDAGALHKRHPFVIQQT